HNGTVYRWNRACYGISENRPHLRIENRVLPAGPTPRDEIANAAFWFGLMSGVSSQYDDITEVMEFDDAASNFNAAARLGIDAQFYWPGCRGHRPANELLRDVFIPLAREGLRQAGIDASDISLYLDTIAERVERDQTGSQWATRSLSRLRELPSRIEQLTSLTAAMVENQRTGRPVHEWPLAEPGRRTHSRENFRQVGQFMSTDLFTVHENDIVDLVANLMDWKHVRHVPVEDDEHCLVGLVSHRALLRFLAQGGTEDRNGHVPVSNIMHRNPVVVSPATATSDAIRLMREHHVGCLPVTQDGETNGRLIGLITEYDLILIAAPLLEEFLEE
ncbi:MAG: CBS domain-containing protein, partial [Phycisphaerales bacterium]|nr:CBS domain-containing protein [Phycisphaerales bacterium]